MAAAIKTITTMVLISIDPFALRRLLLVIVALVGFTALCLADPVLMARRYGHDRAPFAPTKIAAATQISPRAAFVFTPAQPCFWRANAYAGAGGWSFFLDIDND